MVERTDPQHSPPTPGRGDAAWSRRDLHWAEPWWPRFFLVEAGAAALVLAAFVVLALLIDAPLLGVADPEVTPDPSKAPWYFVGLQELLHYYPPVIAGAAAPALAVAFLLALPYMRRGRVWPDGLPSRRRLVQLLAGLAGLLAVMSIPADHPPWVLLLPTLTLALLVLAPGASPRRGPALAWLARRTWIECFAAWLAAVALSTTLVGALFRGPGWIWIWPWIDGMYG